MGLLKTGHLNEAITASELALRTGTHDDKLLSRAAQIRAAALTGGPVPKLLGSKGHPDYGFTGKP